MFFIFLAESSAHHNGNTHCKSDNHYRYHMHNLASYRNRSSGFRTIVSAGNIHVNHTVKRLEKARQKKQEDRDKQLKKLQEQLKETTIAEIQKHENVNPAGRSHASAQ